MYRKRFEMQNSRWDEFGFRVEVEDGPEDRSSKILSMPFVEDPQKRFVEDPQNRFVEYR